MKKVLLSAYACNPSHGSEEGTGWMYASMLSANGLDVHCLTRKDGQAIIESVLAKGSFPNLTVHYVMLPNWVDQFYSFNLFGMYFHYLYWQWSTYRLAQKLDRTYHFDLVHHVTYGSIQLGSFMYKLRKPFIFGPVGGGQRAPKAFRRYFGPYWSREWMRDWIGTLLQYTNPGFYQSVKLANALITANGDTYTLARRLRPDRPIEQLFDGGLRASFIPPQPIVRKPDTGGPMKLLWVGRMLPRKAIELTIQAFSCVNPELPITLTIVGGKGEMAEQVPDYIEQYGVKDRVNCVGHVTFQEVQEHYRQSDIFIFNSLRDTAPHQLLEAMAYSLPIITVDLHGQGEIVNDTTGIRVPVTTEEQVVAALARAIEWMYTHPNERLAMGRAGYTFAQTQVWDQKIKWFTDELYPAILQPTASAREQTDVPSINHALSSRDQTSVANSNTN